MRNISRRDFIHGAGIVAVGGLLSQCAGVSLGPGLRPSFLVSPAMLLSRLRPHFPLRRDYQGLASLQFSQPILAMSPQTNQVRVGLSTLAAGLGRQVGGNCLLACGLRYQPENRAIYLENSQLEQFQLAGVPSQWTQGFRQITNLVGREYLTRHPVFELSDTFGVGLLQSMRVEQGGLRLNFGV